MAESVTNIQFSCTLKATIRNLINGADYTTFGNTLAFSPETTLATGTSANQFDRVWFAENRTINSGSSEDLDMYDLAAFDVGGGAGKDAVGIAFTNVELVALAFWNLAASAGKLFIGAKNATTAFQSLFHVNGTLDDTAGTLIDAGGFVCWFNPKDPAYAIADVSNHLLKLSAPSGNVTYDCMAWFRSA